MSTQIIGLGIELYKESSKGITFEEYREQSLNFFTNYYGSNEVINELGNIQPFWVSLLELIKMYHIENDDILNMDLTGMIEFNKSLSRNINMIPEADGVYAGTIYGPKTDILVKDMMVARGVLTNFRADAYIKATGTVIEQKRNRLKLSEELPADADKHRCHFKNAYKQALTYCCYFKKDETPKRIVTSNFKEIWVYEGRKEDSVIKVPVEDIKNYWNILLPILYDKGGSGNAEELKHGDT